MTQLNPGHCRKAPPWLPLTAAGLVLAGLAGCSPALDWRQLRPEGWQLALDLPCRPASQTRQVPLAGPALELTLLACSVGETTFAAASADVGDPARVGPVLLALAQAAQANVQGRVDRDEPAAVKGMTPHDAARLRWLSGRLPDGRAVAEQVLVFAHGTRVFQATLLGPRIDDRVAQAFFAAFEVRP